MSKTNCINCGHGKDPDEIKCPYCGTTYLDFTSIDFSSYEPVVCQFRMPGNVRDQDGNTLIMSLLARPELEEMSYSYDRMDITSLWDGSKSYLSGTPSMNIGVSFRPIMRKDGSIFTLRSEERA